MTDRQSTFGGEDPSAGYATPVMDLAAAVVLTAIGLWVMIEAVLLPMPGQLFTAPGLLPFLTGASIVIMALALARSALVRRRATEPGADIFELPDDFRRSLGLGAIIIIYVSALQLLPIEAAATILGARVVIGSFEAVSIVVLTTVLSLYWRQPLWACLGVALIWIAFLSGMFRVVFNIPLP